MKFSIRDLLLITFWIAVITAVLLAIARLYSADDWQPWFHPQKQLRQLGLNVCLGLACGGAVGCFSKLYWQGPLIGMGVGFVGGMAWATYVALMAAGAG